MADTATLAIWDALAAAILAGDTPPTRLIEDRFYRDGEVPAQTPQDAVGKILSYFLLGQLVEGPGGFVNQVGTTVRATVHAWASTPAHALRAARWLKLLLDGQRLTLDGFTVSGVVRVSLGGHAADPDGQAYQVPIGLDIETLEAA